MILFVRNIPESTQPKELRAFVEPVLKRRWAFLPARGHVIKVEILSLQNTINKLVEHHGLIFLDSKPAVELALKSLRGKRFKQRALQVREYRHRNPKNDRRVSPSAPNPLIDQRHQDRRRGSIMKHLEHLHTMSLLN